jgi:hypothetical protein
MNLRPNREQISDVTEPLDTETLATKNYIKTSVSLPREIAVKAKEYVHQQQLLHATGQRQSHYSFSQLLNDALKFYLEHLEKGENHEKNR